jgi:hypothetical protein
MWPHIISSSVLQARDTLKFNQLEDVEMIELNALQQLFRSQKQSMSIDSSSRTAAGISAPKQKVLTSKGISQGKFCSVSFAASVCD